jgi:predicted nucleotidyltransferase
VEFLNPEYKEFIQLLNKHQVEYFLLGGYAVNFYGYRRATQDVDFMIRATNENGKKLLDAIEEFGYNTEEYSKENFEDQIHFRLGQIPNSIDVINATVGIDFNEAFQRAKDFQIEGLTVRIIHINDLIANKKALNTYKDLADAEELSKIISNKK